MRKNLKNSFAALEAREAALDKEWYHLHDLANHFKYLCFWKDYARVTRRMDKVDAQLQALGDKLDALRRAGVCA